MANNKLFNYKVIFHVMTSDQWNIKEPYLYEQANSEISDVVISEYNIYSG